jgi:hypothetical protein
MFAGWHENMPTKAFMAFAAMFMDVPFHPA